MGRRAKLTDARVGNATVANAHETEHHDRCTGGDAHERERVADPSMVDGESRLRRVDIVASRSDGTRQAVSFRGDHMVATVGILSQTELLFEIGMLVVGCRHVCEGRGGLTRSAKDDLLRGVALGCWWLGR